ELDALTVGDADAVTADLLAERVSSALAQHDAGDVLGLLGTINGPVGAIRSSFDNMPRSSDDDWEVIASRLEKVPTALASVRAGRMMQGTDLDPREAYDWAWDELHRLEGEARKTIDAILPGATLVGAKAHLDEATAIAGADRWRAWLQDLTDRTTEQVQGTY